MFNTAQGPIYKFNLAVRTKSQGQADWYSVEVFDALGQDASEKVKKGAKVHVQGRLRQDSYEHQGVKRLKLTVVADTLSLVEPRQFDGDAPPPQAQQQAQQQAPQQAPQTAQQQPRQQVQPRKTAPAQAQQQAPRAQPAAAVGSSPEDAKWMDLFENYNNYW